MRRQRPILQSTGNVQPAHAIRMQHEWPRAAECLHPVTVFQIFFGIRRSSLLEIGSIQPSPLSFLLIPPDQLLALAPRLSIRTRRSPVINDTAVIGPCEPPTVSQITLRLTFVGPVLIGIRKHTRINPAAASRAAIFFERLETGQQLAIRHSAAI